MTINMDKELKEWKASIGKHLCEAHAEYHWLLIRTKLAIQRNTPLGPDRHA